MHLNAEYNEIPRLVGVGGLSFNFQRLLQLTAISTQKICCFFKSER